MNSHHEHLRKFEQDCKTTLDQVLKESDDKLLMLKSSIGSAFKVMIDGGIVEQYIASGETDSTPDTEAEDNLLEGQQEGSGDSTDTDSLAKVQRHVASLNLESQEPVPSHPASREAKSVDAGSRQDDASEDAETACDVRKWVSKDHKLGVFTVSLPTEPSGPVHFYTNPFIFD